MPKSSEEHKSQRKESVYRLVVQRETGIRTREIAERLDYKERTARDYLSELEAEYRITKDKWDWFPMPTDLQKPLRFEPRPEEAVVLYIALRMFVKQSDRRNPLAENLLLKMAHLANTELHLGDDLEQAAAALARRETDKDYEDIFRQVVRAYLQRKKLEIVYHPYRSAPFATVISPYLIEPSSFGYGSYAIGHSSTPDALRTYKLERIREAKLTSESFEVPADFPGLEILRNAWSIFYGEAEVHVVLRFAPEVARRVRESNWRGANTTLEDDPQKPGFLRYAFDIADTTDLKPWIRTWGANVEVLEPTSLRDEMTGEARALAHLYGWHTSTSATLDDESYDDIYGD